MAAGRGSKGGAPRGTKPAIRGTRPVTQGKKPSQPAGRAKHAGDRGRPQTPSAPPEHTGPFRLGAIPGATPGKWIATWNERMPRVSLELVPLAVDAQREAVVSASVDAALVRLPIDRDGLHVIPLYDEVPVVVCAVDSHLTAADELTLADLAGEVVIVAADDVLGAEVPDAVAPVFALPESTEDAIATVAAGVGVVIVPMSLARLHHRRDVTHRPLTDGPESTVALAWPVDATGPLVEAFVGIVRGRTANSSRT